MTVTQPDPIFIAIAAHIKADAEAVRVCSAPDYIQGGKKQAKAYENGPLKNACEAAEKVCSTVPTTIAGCHALALFVLDFDLGAEDLLDQQARLNKWTATATALSTLLQAIAMSSA